MQVSGQCRRSKPRSVAFAQFRGHTEGQAGAYRKTVRRLTLFGWNEASAPSVGSGNPPRSRVLSVSARPVRHARTTGSAFPQPTGQSSSAAYRSAAVRAFSSGRRPRSVTARAPPPSRTQQPAPVTVPPSGTSRRLPGRKTEHYGMGPAVVLGQGLAEAATPVWHGAVAADLAVTHTRCLLLQRQESLWTTLLCAHAWITKCDQHVAVAGQ